MSLVAPNLYVGDESAASSLSRLRSNQITHVLNCTDQPNQIHSVPTGLADGTTTTADTAYLRESITDPTAKVPDGYDKEGVGMPTYLGILTDPQIDSLVLYIQSL